MRSIVFRVWARGGAIRPVAAFARLDKQALDRIEARLADDGDDDPLDAAFERFEQTQPALAEHITQVLSRPIDETALGLGYFLSIAIWLAFESQFGARLRTVELEEMRATDASLDLEESLRAENAEDPATVDDVIAQEQPDAANFIHEHVEAALDADPGPPADVGDVDTVYRAALVVLLSLSHAVEADERVPVAASREILA